MVLRALHLCSGYGGFELALRDITRTVGHVERDAYAAAVLVARMEEQRLDQAPIWSDLTTFDAEPWRGRVDLVTAGFPCQPFSAAGQKRGVDDDRWLWPEIARIIRDVQPRYVFLENVPQLVRHGLPEVLHDLAQYGFDAEWGLYSAAAVGAPHRRQRIWIVAHAEGAGRDERVDSALARGLPADIETEGRDVADTDRNGLQGIGWQPKHDGDTRHDTDRSGGEDVAHTDRQKHEGGGVRQHEPTELSQDVADTAGVDERKPDHQGRPDARCDSRPDIGGHRFPPSPDDLNGWEQWDGAQPSIRRSTDGTTEWLADALHLGGNGLVPQCAREAWFQLTERFV